MDRIHGKCHVRRIKTYIRNMNMSLLLIPRAHEHNAAQLLFFWWVSYSEHLNCRIIFNVVIENKQCLHLCKQSTCKVADEYDSWFNLSLISKRGCVKCAWLNHECWVKKWLHCVMGSQLCKWSLFDASIHSRRSMQILIWTGLTPGRRSQPRHLVPHSPIMKRRLQSDHELTTKREWCEIEEPVVQKVIDVSISSEWAEIREQSVTLVFSRVKQTYMFCCTVQACALIGFDSFTSLLATHQPLFCQAKKEISKWQI